MFFRRGPSTPVQIKREFFDGLLGMVCIVVFLFSIPAMMKQKAKREVFRREEAMLSKWKAMIFRPAEEFTSTIELRDISVESEVTKELHKEALVSAVQKFLNAYRTGVFDDFARFRFGKSRDEVTLTFPGTAMLGAISDQNFSIPPFVLKRPALELNIEIKTNTAIDIARTFWDTKLVFLRNPRDNAPAYCFDCVEGFSMDGIKLKIEKEALTPVSLVHLCNETNSAGLFKKLVFFQVEPSLDELRNSGKKTMFANAYVVLKTTLSKPCFPVWLHFYWNEVRSE